MFSSGPVPRAARSRDHMGVGGAFPCLPRTSLASGRLPPNLRGWWAPFNQLRTRQEQEDPVRGSSSHLTTVTWGIGIFQVLGLKLKHLLHPGLGPAVIWTQPHPWHTWVSPQLMADLRTCQSHQDMSQFLVISLLLQVYVLSALLLWTALTHAAAV